MFEASGFVDRGTDAGTTSRTINDVVVRYDQMRAAARNTRLVDPNDIGLDESLVIEAEERIAAEAARLYQESPHQNRLDFHALYMAAVRLDSIRERAARHGDSSGLWDARKESESEIEGIVQQMSNDVTRSLRSLVPAFAWWMVWWTDARKDALSLVFSPGDDAFRVGLLGRPPSGHQHLSRSFYERACDADRNHDTKVRGIGALSANSERGHL